MSIEELIIAPAEEKAEAPSDIEKKSEDSAEIEPEEADPEEADPEEDAPKKKSIWNTLLVITLVIIGLLTALYFFIVYQQERTLDLSVPYSAVGLLTSDTTTAKPFTEDLVVSDGAVVAEDITLNASTEKGLLFNLDTNEAVFAQGIYDKAYPASITKIMTAILVMKYANMSDVVVMQESDFDLEAGSQVSGMIPGDTVTMEQLFHTLVIYSANDAAMAIARHMDGSVENFAAHMNEEAQKLGMIGTHFVNPHGLHDSEHYTCAYDVYLMLQEAVKYPAFSDAIRMNVYNLSVTRADGSVIRYRLDSTDKYLTGEKKAPSGVTLWGGKTGTTPEAGSCLALVAQNENGIPFVSVILNAENSSKLYEDMNKLLCVINF